MVCPEQIWLVIELKLLIIQYLSFNKQNLNVQPLSAA